MHQIKNKCWIDKCRFFSSWHNKNNSNIYIYIYIYIIYYIYIYCSCSCCTIAEKPASVDPAFVADLMHYLASLFLRSCFCLNLSLLNSSFSWRKVNISELVVLDFSSFGWSSPPISPYRPIAVLLISKAVWLSFSIDFLSATSCSDFSSLCLYLFISSSSRVSNSVSSCPPRPVPWTSFLILRFIFSHDGGETFSNCTKSYRKTWISIEVSCNLLPNLIPLSTFWFVLENSQWGHLSLQKQFFFLIPLHSYPKNNKSYLKLKVRGGQSLKSCSNPTVIVETHVNSCLDCSNFQCTFSIQREKDLFWGCLRNVKRIDALKVTRSFLDFPEKNTFRVAIAKTVYYFLFPVLSQDKL